MIPAEAMIDKATVRRPGTSGYNQYDTKINTLAAAHLTDEPCRLDLLRAPLAIGPNLTAPAGSPLVFFNVPADVKPDDVIVLTTKSGEILTIKALSARRAPGFEDHHLEVVGSLRP